MYCNNCGTKLPDNSKFCHVCGEKMPDKNNKYENNRYYNEEPSSNQEVIITPEVIEVKDKPQPVMQLEVPGSKKIAVWSIIIYASVFYVLSQIIAPIILALYVAIKDIPVPAGVDDIASYLLLYYENDYYNILALSNLLCYIPILVGLILISLKVFRCDLLKIRHRVGKFFAYFGIGFGILYGATLTANVIVSVLLAIYETILSLYPEIQEAFGSITSSTSGNQESINNMMSSGLLPLISMAFVTVVAAPICEELVFRKSFFALSKKKGIACIIVSGLLFGAIHVIESVLIEVLGLAQGLDGYTITNIIVECINLISYVASGIAFGIVYKLSKYNIWVTIMIHSVYNLLGFLLLFLV